MRKIRLNDGSVYTVDRCGTSDQLLYINVTDTFDLLELVMVFGVGENVNRIEHFYEGTETDHLFYDGYDSLIAANLSTTGVTLVLKKG